MMLVGVVLLAAFWLRFHDLDRNPPELLNDELAGVVSAWTLITTGHDIEQTHVPFLPTRLEFKQPAYYFATIIPQALLGPRSTLAARLPAACLGLLSTVLILWLGRVLGRSRAEALLAAALFATVPWAVHLGRIGWEPAAFLPPTLAGLGLLWVGLEGHDSRRIVCAAVVLALGAYTYHPALLMNLLLTVTALALHLRGLRRSDVRALLVGAGSALVLLGPYIDALISEPVFTLRTRNIFVFSQGTIPDAIGLAWVNYWQQWNPQWLFLSAPANLRYHPNTPLLFLWMALFLGLGLVRLLRSASRSDHFLLLWLLIGPLPAGLTNDGVPQFARGLLALPPILMATAVGLSWVGHSLEKVAQRWGRPLVLALAVLLAGGAGFYGLTTYHTYFTNYAQDVAPQLYSPAPALRLVPDVVPAGGTLCIDVDDGVDYWTFWHHVAYYLERRDFEVVEGIEPPRCTEPGTYILFGLLHNPSPARVPAPTRVAATVPARSAHPLFVFAEVMAP